MVQALDCPEADVAEKVSAIGRNRKRYAILGGRELGRICGAFNLVEGREPLGAALIAKMWNVSEEAMRGSKGVQDSTGWQSGYFMAAVFAISLCALVGQVAAGLSTNPRCWNSKR